MKRVAFESDMTEFRALADKVKNNSIDAKELFGLTVIKSVQRGISNAGMNESVEIVLYPVNPEKCIVLLEDAVSCADCAPRKEFYTSALGSMAIDTRSYLISIESENITIGSNCCHYWKFYNDDTNGYGLMSAMWNGSISWTVIEFI